MDVWTQALQEIYDRKKVPQRTYKSWFQGTTLESQDDGVVVVKAPSDTAAVWLQQNHGAMVNEVLGRILGGPVEVRFVADRNGDFEHTKLNFDLEKSGESNDLLVEAYQTAEKELPNVSPTGQVLHGGALVPWYTFQTYVVGPSNEFAYNAAVAVSESLGTVYNPLFIYGGVGLGKTHLVHAVAHAVQEEGRQYRVLYCTCEQFTNDFIQCVRNKKMDDFHQHYRNIDILIIDDIQFLGRTKATQEEFFHTFNSLYLSQKQILLTSDRPPGEIPLLQDRLRSRFQQGVLVDIAPPDFEMRVAILQKKAERLSMDLPEDVAFFLANHLTLHVRQLEGCLASLKAVTALRKKKITLSLAQETLANFLTEGKKTITVDSVVKAVSEEFRISEEDLRSRRRDAKTALARQVAMYLARELTTLSAKDVAAGLQKRDHTTVLHAVKKVRDDMQDDEELRERIESIRTHLLEG